MGTANVFTTGCRTFHKKAVRNHMATWHTERIGGDIAKGLSKTIDDHAEKIKHIMLNVYWLAKEKIALHKIGSLYRLVGLLQYKPNWTLCCL